MINFSTAYPSPNFNDRTAAISAIVIHYTDMENAKAALERLCDPAAEVSCHYLIDYDGSLYQLVAEDKRAWHAGRSYWQARENVNDFSIGIELVNPGTDFVLHPFTKKQMSCGAELCAQLIAEYQIHPSCIIGHSDIAPDRKIDPGEYFDWGYLAERGIGLLPDASQVKLKDNLILCHNGEQGERVLKLQQDLQRYGYKIKITGQFDAELEKVVVAFKRHFYRDNMSVNWDSKAEAILAGLLLSL